MNIAKLNFFGMLNTFAFVYLDTVSFKLHITLRSYGPTSFVFYCVSLMLFCVGDET